MFETVARSQATSEIDYDPGRDQRFEHRREHASRNVEHASKHHIVELTANNGGHLCNSLQLSEVIKPGDPDNSRLLLLVPYKLPA